METPGVGDAACITDLNPQHLPASFVPPIDHKYTNTGITR